ncbi:hypothetical protein H6B11_05455 [Mediterraneibacter glycyrrhizinilyticus]|nr:hypothetical protein [Mediterraneibacter glycyrrhizinilyticus]MBM6853608.1 hypothetical protein [Mediterraneibacter glycyrrhizinilyticus]
MNRVRQQPSVRQKVRQGAVDIMAGFSIGQEPDNRKISSKYSLAMGPSKWSQNPSQPV